LEANYQVIESQIENNLENGEEYARLIKTPYQNLILDRQILKTEERLAKHMSILPQEVIRWDIWIEGLQRRHNSK
jgi:hypothetical protein